jgi:hypothetical protein
MFDAWQFQRDRKVIVTIEARKLKNVTIKARNLTAKAVIAVAIITLAKRNYDLDSIGHQDSRIKNLTPKCESKYKITVIPFELSRKT